MMKNLIRDMILQGIKQAGFRCIAAADGDEALNLMEKNQVDIVIADINMPGMNGIELTKKIKESFNSHVIIMTGFVKDFSYESVIAQGASDFIQKPVTLDELELRLQRVLKERIILAERNKAEEENKQALQKLRKIITGTIYAMAMTIEIRDPYTAGHQRRVASLSRAIGKNYAFLHFKSKGLAWQE
jgi:putative two-component system response regulator